MHVQDINNMDVYRRRYDYTAYLSRRDWAWEHIRRNPRFEAVAYANRAGAVSTKPACFDIHLMKMRRAQPEAEEWGLIAFPDPALNAPRAPVFWTDDACRSKVLLTVSERRPGETDTIYQTTVSKCRIWNLTDWTGTEHLMISGIGCSIQARCKGLSLLSNDPVIMSFDVSGLPDWEYYTKVLERSTRVFGDYSRKPVTFSQKAKLLRNGLIALDGKRAGLSDRQVAHILFDEDAVQSGVKKGDTSLVRRVKHYREKALALSEGGYRSLLDPAVV